jgi:hypothetical protein
VEASGAEEDLVHGCIGSSGIGARRVELDRGKTCKSKTIFIVISANASACMRSLTGSLCLIYFKGSVRVAEAIRRDYANIRDRIDSLDEEGDCGCPHTHHSRHS